MGIARLYPQQSKFNEDEKKEFRRLLRNNPELKREYGHFKSASYQELRTRTEGSPWLDRNLDMLFEGAAISGL